MGTITGTNLAAKASILLLDVGNTRWPLSEILGWINSGQKEIAVYKPNSSVLNAVIATVAGTKQSLPSSAPIGLQLFNVIRNMGTGSTPGAPVTNINMDVLNVVVPDWHNPANAALSVKHYMTDAKEPKTFYVYPPLKDATQKLEVSMGVQPADLATIGDVITVDDIYEPVLLDYIMYRAYLKNGENPGEAALAQQYQKSYLQAVGAKAGAETAFAPTTKGKQ